VVCHVYLHAHLDHGGLWSYMGVLGLAWGVLCEIKFVAREGGLRHKVCKCDLNTCSKKHSKSNHTCQE
jgi:hypothetical protein